MQGGALRGGAFDYRKKPDDHVFRGFSSRKSSSKDWRDNLFTVFVDNISCRVPKSAVWEVFDLYGKVVDVFIGVPKSWRRQKRITYAFVRYKTLSEMQKAVQEGNNRLIDGRYIWVKKASFGWKDRIHVGRLSQRHGSNREDLEGFGQSVPVPRSVHRSYRDVVLGNCKEVVSNEAKGVATSQETLVGTKKFDYPSGHKEDLNFDPLLLPQEEMEWLDRCAVGQIRNAATVSLLRGALNSANITCSIFQWAELRWLLSLNLKKK
ncbi:hypothetical protein DITRI_Ditri18aG0004100 [Diplodiscus trichospermus]